MTILFWGMFVLEAGLGIFAEIAIFVSALMLLYEHRIVSKDFSKIDKAFFTINGYLGIIFLILIILDFI